jgi:hypothetical protein
MYRGRPKIFTEKEQKDKKKEYNNTDIAKAKRRLNTNKYDENKRLLKHLQSGKSAETFEFKYLNVNLDKTIENSYITII